MQRHEYVIELRCGPDTDEIEGGNIKSSGSQSALQTVIYGIVASSEEEAIARAIANEECFTHRKGRKITVLVKGKNITADLGVNIITFDEFKL